MDISSLSERREQFIMEFLVLTFVGVLIVIALTVAILRYVRRRHDKTDLDIKTAIDHVDFHAENNELDHKSIGKRLDGQHKRLQFLTAKEIAVHLAEEKALEIERQRKAKSPPPEDTQ